MNPDHLRRVLAIWGALVAVVLVVLMIALAEPFEPDSFGPGHDARAYWAAPLDDPYEPGSVGEESAYLYSPAFLVALSPLRALSWPLFLGLWTGGLLAVLFWLARPLLFLPLLLLALPEIWGGNITILLAAAIVLGFSRPFAWAFPLLTKVTPGVGVLWFAARREWLNFGLAIAATTAIIAAAAMFVPGALGRVVPVAAEQHRLQHRARLGAHPAACATAAGHRAHRLRRPARRALAPARRRAAGDARHLVGQPGPADRIGRTQAR